MITDRRGALGMLAAAPVAASADPASPVTVFEAGKIITMEPSMPQARFVAVADGAILGLANELSALDPWLRGRSSLLNREFAGQVLMPGLVDPHVHPVQSAVMLNLPFLAPDDWPLPGANYPGVRTPTDYRARLAEQFKRAGPGPFITWGYHELFHGGLGRKDLDGLSAKKGVIVWQRSFHDVIVNSAALRDWGLGSRERFDAAIAAAKADPRHADFERGLFSETALPIALGHMRPAILSPEKMTSGMKLLGQMLLANGVTTISDMGTGVFAGFDAEARLISASFETMEIPARVMLMPMANEIFGEADPRAWLMEIERRFASRRVRVDRRVKLFADGAFFAQNMRMKPPGYTDGHHGKWLTEPDMIAAQLVKFWQAGFSLHVHVNGDEGLEVVLDGIAALPVRPGQTITLEHLGFSTEAQNRRIARMGLMVSAQPNYIRVLGDAYSRVGFGPDRAATINRLGSLERKGVALGLHSDFNMAPIDPLYLAWIAANRVTLDGNVLAPAERLSLDKALRAVTIEAAQVIGMDHMVGSVAAGKKADFAVLSADPYALGAERLNEIEVLNVIFEGSPTSPRPRGTGL